MSFATTLDGYCKALNRTNQDIALACDVSPSTLSRYRNGVHTPDDRDEVVDNLASGIARMARATGTPGKWDESEIRQSLKASLSEADMVGMDFNMRFDAIMNLTGMRNAKVAQILDVDPSYISRIRKGQRQPGNMRSFATTISLLAAHFCLERNLIDDLGDLTGMPMLALEAPDWETDDESSIAEVIEVWLLGDNIVRADMMRLKQFFIWCDTTDFSPWLTLEGAPTEKASSQPAPFARFYYGVGAMRNAEIGFLETTSASHAQTMSLSSDMPLMQIEPSSSFLERYQQGIIKVLKTGCHVNVIFNMERPLEETIRSLRMWHPLYMTGRVSPHYLIGLNNRLFCHVNYVSDVCALSSEAVMGHAEDGRYYLTTRPEDLQYYRRKMGYILEKSSSLLDIYRDIDPGRLEQFRKAEEELRTTAPGRAIGEDLFKNIRVTSYPRNHSVLTIPCDGGDVHLVIRHPKINYAIALMK